MRARLSTVLVVCAAVSLAAQTAPPREASQSTFRSAANFVRVDMYATREGVPIDDLRAEDVDVLEDGVSQTLENFEHVTIRPAGSPDTRIEPNTVAESRQMAADPRARVFVIYLDTYNTQIEGSANMRLPLVKFLDRVLGPDDLVGVMTPQMAATDLTFGRKTALISNVMNDAFWGQRGRATNADRKEDTYDACYPPRRGESGSTSAIAREMKDRRREKLALDALDDLTVHLNGIREERKAVLVVTEGWRLYAPSRELADSSPQRPAIPAPGGFGRGRRAAGDPGTDTDRQSSAVDRIECDTDRVALANLDHRLRLRDITETANRGNVSFYTVYARGLAAFDAPIGPDRPPSLKDDSANLSARQDGLRFLAENTDAVSIINTNNVDGALARIAADVSSYYLLRYYSTNTKLDGKFRNITVRVKRPGAQVRARRGYRGPTADSMFGGSESTAAPATFGGAANVAVVGVNTRAPFRLRTAAWRGATDADTPALWIVGELDYSTRRQVAWSSGASAEVSVLAGDGKQIATATVPVAAAEGGFTLQLPDSAAISPGEYAIRVSVRSEADPQAAVSETARAVIPSKPSVLGEAILSRRGPSTGLRHLSTADPRFLRTERLRLELPTHATGTAVARMLDRTGKPLQIPLQVTERPDAAGFRWLVVDTTLAPLAAGDYAIEVVMGEAKQLTAFRIVP